MNDFSIQETIQALEKLSKVILYIFQILFVQHVNNRDIMQKIAKEIIIQRIKTNKNLLFFQTYH